jgi:transposase
MFMISSTRVQRIFLIEHGVDFRRAHNGLLAEAYRLQLDPYQGDLLLFIGKKKNRLKAMYADATGLWVSSKIFTLEAMKTRFRFVRDPSCKSITTGELGMLLEGAAYSITKKVTPYAPKQSLT